MFRSAVFSIPVYGVRWYKAVMDTVMPIALGVFFGLLMATSVVVGLVEGFKHTDDRDMPGWALAAIGIPGAIATVLCYLYL